MSFLSVGTLPSVDVLGQQARGKESNLTAKIAPGPEEPLPASRGWYGLLDVQAGEHTGVVLSISLGCESHGKTFLNGFLD